MPSVKICVMTKNMATTPMKRSRARTKFTGPGWELLPLQLPLGQRLPQHPLHPDIVAAAGSADATHDIRRQAEVDALLRVVDRRPVAPATATCIP